MDTEGIFTTEKCVGAEIFLYDARFGWEKADTLHDNTQFEPIMKLERTTTLTETTHVCVERSSVSVDVPSITSVSFYVPHSENVTQEGVVVENILVASGNHAESLP